MNLINKAGFLRKAWRYRLHSEKFSLRFLLSRHLNGKTAVDIGANLGIYSFWMHRKVGPTGAVIAFEPQPELNLHLNRLKESFGLGRLKIAETGLSSWAATRPLVRPRDHWGGASLESRPVAGTETLQVDLSTLDAYLRPQAMPPVGIVKCDVEGHELEAFQGARRTLEQDRPDLVFECGDPEDPHCATFAFLAELEYDCLCFWRGGFIPVSQYGRIQSSLHRKASHNFIALPRESAAPSRRCA